MNESPRPKLTDFHPSEPVFCRDPAPLRPNREDQRRPELSSWQTNTRLPLASVPEPLAERRSNVADRRSNFPAVSTKSVRIAIKTKGKILLLDPADILSVEAEGNYVLLVRPSGSHLLRESISTMAEKLKPYHFVRIHRSVLVNAACVEEICTGNTGEYMLRLSTGKPYVVSRTYKNNLKLLAQSWIGIDSFGDDCR